MSEPSSGRVEVESRASSVTFFEDRAEVRRLARAPLRAGVQWVAIGGISLVVEDSSLLAQVEGERARVLGARVIRRVHPVAALDGKEIDALEQALQRARGARAHAQRTVSRAEAERERLLGLGAAWRRTVQRVPRGADAVSGGRAAFERLEGGLSLAMTQLEDGRNALARTVMEEERTELRLAQGRALVPRYEASVEVQLEAQDSHEAELTLTYRTACALWRPEHLARLERTPEGKWELVLRTFATAWQRTGERWTEVACTFSTARPARSATPPLLEDDVLTVRRKSVDERKAMVVEARDETIALAGASRGARTVEELPGVEDGGEPLSFTAPRPSTVPGDGRPFRIELAETRLPAEVDCVAFPERSEGAFLRALATRSGAVPLLAGPVWAMRGTELVGRSKVGFVAAGEPFELGFGTDDGLRVRRELHEARDTVPILGTQKITRKLKVFVSNLSGEPRKLIVTERIPVSELAEVKVEVLESTGARADRTDGFVKFDLELGAHATRVVELHYRIEAGARVRLPF